MPNSFWFGANRPAVRVNPPIKRRLDSTPKHKPHVDFIGQVSRSNYLHAAIPLIT